MSYSMRVKYYYIRAWINRYWFEVAKLAIVFTFGALVLMLVLS